MGKLIVVEGACDGIGKTTQFNMLYARLKNNGEDIVNHHFPSYGTYGAAAVEKYLNGEFGKPSELSPYFVNMLYAEDRAITWFTDLKALYDHGKIILLDRYTTSSLIYQSALFEKEEDRKNFVDYVLEFEYKKIGLQEPDKVVFLHAPFDLVAELRNARKQNEGIENDIHESDLEFMRKVYDSAMFIADYLSWDKVQCNDGKEMRTINDIHNEVYSLVKKRN